MILDYIGVKEINGSLIVLDDVENASFEEVVDIRMDDGTMRQGRIVQMEGKRVVIQVFEGTRGISLQNTRTRLLGHPMEMPLSPEILGRVFDGAGRPIDGLGDIFPLKRANINTVEDLISKTEDEMIKVRNLGRKSLEEVEHKLAMMGLSLASDDNQ